MICENQPLFPIIQSHRSLAHSVARLLAQTRLTCSQILEEIISLHYGNIGEKRHENPNGIFYYSILHYTLYAKGHMNSFPFKHIHQNVRGISLETSKTFDLLFEISRFISLARAIYLCLYAHDFLRTFFWAPCIH